MQSTGRIINVTGVIHDHIYLLYKCDLTARDAVDRADADTATVHAFTDVVVSVTAHLRRRRRKTWQPVAEAGEYRYKSV